MEAADQQELNQPVSVIIPAYNEATRIGAVLRLALSSGIFSEVIVVDDGSRDGTSTVARECGARVIRHERNQGKPAAMLSGLKETDTEVICFLDADLRNVTQQHLHNLVDPVVKLETPATLGIFTGASSAAVLAQKICPMLSGQRCVQRSTLEGFEDWDSGFGIETAINDHLLKLGIRQLLVEWPGAGQVHKEEKRGWLIGFADRLRMYWQIIAMWLKTRFRR